MKSEPEEARGVPQTGERVGSHREAGTEPRRAALWSHREAEQEKRRGSEGEHRDDRRPAPPLQKQVLAQGDDHVVHAPSAKPLGSAPAGARIPPAGPEKTRRPASSTKAREQRACPRRNR